MKKEKDDRLYLKYRPIYVFSVVACLLASVPLSMLPPRAMGDMFPYPVLGVVSSCDGSLSFPNARVTVQNPRTGVTKSDSVSVEGLFLVTFGNLMGPDEWYHGDPLLVWVNGTGDYGDYRGSLVTQFDKHLVPPHRVNITLCTEDATPPETSHVIAGIPGCRDWYTSNVTITLTASDESSGVQSTFYRIGNASFENYSHPFTLIREGIENLTYFSRDTRGNTEPMKTVSIKIDKISPKTNCFLTPPVPQGNNGWYTGPVNVLLASIDKTSGVNITGYRWNNEDWQEYRDPLNREIDGEHTLDYYSRDQACNAEDTQSVQIKIDTLGPQITLKKPRKNTLYVFDRELVHIPIRTIVIGKITLKTEASDTPSGIEKVLFYVDGTLAYADSRVPYEWLYDDSSLLVHHHTLMVQAIDVAGNIKESDTQDIWFFNL